MNTKALRNLKSTLLNHIDFVGSFGIAAGGAIDDAVKRGAGYTPTKVGAETGIYRVTLDSALKSPKHFGVTATIFSASSGDVALQVIAADAQTGVFDFQTKKASDGTDVDPAAACEIHFRIALGNTSLPDAT
jgi:hypothetical protein